LFIKICLFCNSSNIDTKQFAASVCQLRGDGVSAMRDYQHAIQLNPNYSLPYYNAANVYFFSHQFKQASNCDVVLSFD